MSDEEMDVPDTGAGGMDGMSSDGGDYGGPPPDEQRPRRTIGESPKRVMKCLSTILAHSRVTDPNSILPGLETSRSTLCSDKARSSKVGTLALQP